MHFISPDVSFRHAPAMHYSNDFKKKTRHPYGNLTCTHPRSSLRYLMDRRLDVYVHEYTQRWSGINNIHNEATAARTIGYRLDRRDEGV